jgi:hypothetical protein
LDMVDMKTKMNYLSWPDFTTVFFEKGHLQNFNSLNVLHQRNMDFLIKNIPKYKSQGKKLLVVSHFAPTWDSIDKKFAKSATNHFFYNSLETYLQNGGLFNGVDAWFHGHTHASAQSRFAKTEIYCNPAGYPRQALLKHNLDEEYFEYPLENKEFTWNLQTKKL